MIMAVQLQFMPYKHRSGTCLRCDGGRRSAVLTIFRDATAINDGTTAEPRRSMTEPLRNHSDHGGATAVYAVQAPKWHRASGVTGVEGPRF